MKKDEIQEMKESLRREYVKITENFLDEIDKKIDKIVTKTLGSHVDIIVDKTTQSFDNAIKKQENKVDELLDALVDVMSHLMAQNELIAELLVSKEIMNSKDIKHFQHETEKRIPELIYLINDSVGRETNTKLEKKIKTMSKRHPETIKALKKIIKEKHKKRK